MGVLAKLRAGIKSFWAETHSPPVMLPGSSVDWSLRSSPLWDTSVVNICLQYLIRNFPEAQLQVELETSYGWQRDDNHPFTDLFARPNPFYGFEVLLAGLLISYYCDGNAYIWINRAANGQPAELWYLPHMLVTIECGNNTSEFVRGYRYRSGTRSELFKASDVIHLRCGLNPARPQYGMSPLSSVLREVVSDIEATTYTAAILKNMGIPGAVIAPKSDNYHIDQDQASLVRELYTRRTSGDERGQALVMTTPVEVMYPNVSPQNMALESIRQIPEARIAAAFGLPAVVVGLLVGMQHTATYNNIREAREAAWEECILPVQKNWAAELTRSLQPGRGRRIVFDNRQVRALQADQMDLVKRLEIAVKGGWLSVAEARAAMGLEVRPGDNVYLRPSGIMEWDNE